MEKGVPIRVISRTLDVLKAVNRGKSLTLTEISRICDLPYPTTVRIVQSLVYEGIIELEPQRKAYRPTALAQSLSYGYQEENAFAASARASIVQLTHEIGWPVAICTRVGESMVIRDSTHSLTTLTFSQYYPGFAMPIWATASGKVHLAFCGEKERNNIIESLQLKYQNNVDTSLLDEKLLTEIIVHIRKVGYAAITRNQHTIDPGKTSSIAVPLERNGKYAAALTIAFFASAMTPDEAVDKYLPSILKTQKEINRTTPAFAEKMDESTLISHTENRP